MKGSLFFLLCAFALAISEESVELYENGCPVDVDIHKVLPHETYCNLFYNCDAGTLVEQRCPGELLFNVIVEVCDWPTQVNCEGKGIRPHDSESEESVEESNAGGNSDPSQAAAICASADSDGVLIAHENCDKYNVCDKGHVIVMRCPGGLLYNYNLGVCDWPNNVECGDRTISDSSEV